VAPPTFEELIGLWEEGQRRLRDADPADRPIMERVVAVLVDELAHVYVEQGTDWCFDIAVREAPNTPAAWDLPTVAGAAFARYVRTAMDFGGGRRREDDR
jgi:hypothetical protein